MWSLVAFALMRAIQSSQSLLDVSMRFVDLTVCVVVDADIVAACDDVVVEVV